MMSFRSIMLILKSLPHVKLLQRFTSTNSSQLVDNHNRIHNYLRISITDKCNLRCKYCMPKEGIKLDKLDSYLKLDEFKRLADVFVKECSIKKVRLTGGEPTINRNCLPLLRHLNNLRAFGLEEIGITTNGLTLKKHAPVLKDLGINFINISLDTFKEEKFELITRRKGWRLAFDGLMYALEAGFDKVKLNSVVMRDVNDDEIEDFINLASLYPIEVRFIEFMPFLGNDWIDKRLVPSKQLLSRAIQLKPDLTLVKSTKNATSKVYSSPSMIGSIGFISSMTDNFCSGCNRLRITSDGQLKVCLFGREEFSMRDLIRNGANDEELVKAIKMSLSHKQPQHAGLLVLKAPKLSIENQSGQWLRSVGNQRANIILSPDISCLSYDQSILPGKRTYHSPSSNDDESLSGFSHLDNDGNISMVDVNKKKPIERTAVARGRIYVGNEVLSKLDEGSMSKGSVISTAKIAGIMGSKMTSQLIPLCHHIPLDHIGINIERCIASGSLIVTASVKTHHRTGVEMESLTAVSVTLLTIYDMCKSVNKSMVITDIELLSKMKG